MGKSKPFTIEDLQAKGFHADEKGEFIKNKPIGTKPYNFPLIDNFDYHESTLNIKKDKRPKATIKIPKDKPEGLQAIENVLKAAGIKYETEYRFNEIRRFRFDCAIIDKKIAIEYEGLMSKKSRHTTISGYVGDCRKYNFAQIQGWKILRYTAINYKEFVEDLKHFL